MKKENKKELKKEEAAKYLKKLKEKLKYYRRVVINSNDAIIIQDFKGMIRAWNRSATKIYGFNESEMIGQNIAKIISKDERVQAMRNIAAIKNGKPTFRIRQTRITKEGEKVFVTVTYSPIYEDEEIIEIGTIEKDITQITHVGEEVEKSILGMKLTPGEKKFDFGKLIKLIREETKKRKEAEEKASKAEKLAALGRLTGILGHELRNPLSVIRNATYYLSNRDIKDVMIKKYIQIMNAEAINAENVINGIFIFARVQDMRKTHLDINKNLKKIIEELKMPDKIKVIFKFDQVSLLNMAEIHLSQVIRNLVSNSIDSMSHGGTITIETFKKDNQVEIDIADTGKGISKRNLHKIFTPLFSTKYKGTGLGLSVCQHVLSLYDGTIHLESKVGKGTKAIIRIPIEGGKAYEKSDIVSRG